MPVFLFFIFFTAFPPSAQISAQNASAARPIEIRTTNTYPELWVEGKPFFIYGAAFFYPRLPRDLWESSLRTARAMGINTVDLYIPWNWHEPQQGQIDFDGRTNPRKDLIGLLNIISRLGLKAIVRPGPYITAEWKNGGYPDWLLRRPEYKMSERSVLEGRYPPLSSLQYEDSDAAARAWMQNPTHLKYTRRWYRLVAQKILKPYSIEKGGPILLVQLDDDQPAGTRTNGPHFWEYMKWLRDTLIRSGVSLPLYLNPSETYVPALGRNETGPPHLWLMAQWFQRYYGPALSTGDYESLEAAAQYLKTDPEYPPAIIEFHAGFFALENDPYGMPADPSGTLTAQRVLFQNGLKGLVNYPLQDSIYPAGYEIPSTNPYYTWESALDVSGKEREKARGVERNGRLIQLYGELWARSHEWADAGLVYPLAALDFTHISPSAIQMVQTEVGNLQKKLIRHKIRTDFVDPQNQPLEQLLRYPTLFQPASSASLPPLSSQARKNLRDYASRGGNLITLDPASAQTDQTLSDPRFHRKIQSDGWVYGSELVSDVGSLPLGNRDKDKGNYGFVLITNLGEEDIKTEISAADPYDPQRRISLGNLSIPGKDSLCLPLRVRLARLLGKLPGTLGESDEIYSATAELNGARAGGRSIQMTFYNPAESEIKLRLKRRPERVYLGHEEYRRYSWDPSNRQMTLFVPPGSGSDFLQTLELSYGPFEEFPVSKETQPLLHDFPTRIDILMRPDIHLPTVPPLLLAKTEEGRNLVPLSLQNPSDGPDRITVLWASDTLRFSPSKTTFILSPAESRSLNFEATVSPTKNRATPLYPATVILQDENTRQEIPVQVLTIPPGRPVHYSYDLDRDGSNEEILENSKLRVVLSPRAGGRIFQMVSKNTKANIVASPGILRDVFTLMNPLDTSWESEKLPDWTRSRVPGLNTRPYSVTRIIRENNRAGVSLSYQAPDVYPQGAWIKKTISLEGDDPRISVDYEVRVASGAPGQALKIQNVILLDGQAQLWYGKDGKTQRQSLEKEVSEQIHPDWIAIRNTEDSWAVEWSAAAGVSIKTKRRYAVAETDLGPLSASARTYRYRLRYYYGPDALKEIQASPGLRPKGTSGEVK